MKDARQKAQQIVDEFLEEHVKIESEDVGSHFDLIDSPILLRRAIEQALQEAAKVELGKRCPCGGIILADTDECKVPVCIECCVEISKSYLNMDENYNEGFKRGMEAAKVEWPSESARLHARRTIAAPHFRDMISRGQAIQMMFDYECWLKSRMSKEG